MKRKVIPVVALLLVVAGNAWAGSVSVTPPLVKGTAVWALCCVANLDTKDAANPTVEMVKSDGSVDATVQFFLPASGFGCLGDATPVSSYCRVSGVPSNRARVSYCMADASNDCISTVTAPTK